MSRDVSALRRNLDELAGGSPLKLLFRYSWPALVSMTLNALYCVVDRFYIGQGCGEDAMAGMTLTYPVMLLMVAFGVLIGMGHSAILSIKLGEGDRVTAEKLLGELVALKLIVFLILPPLIFFNLDTVLDLCGAAKVTPGARAAAATYLKIVVFSHVFSHLAFGLSAMQRSEGGAIKSMMSLVVGFSVNLILDPILIFGFGMGIAGAAWATVIAMVASCAWALKYYLLGETAVRLRWQRLWLYPQLLRRTTLLGLAPFLLNLMSSLIGMSLSRAFTQWAADLNEATAQVASLGVFQGVLIILFMPIMGAQQGLQPILGYNWGARNFARVRETLKCGFYITTLLCILAALVQIVPPFPQLLARCFISGDKPELIRLAAHDLQVSNCMLWMISFNVIATTYFQSIGKPRIAILLSMLRQGVILLPCIWLLPYLMEDKMLAIWLALPISDVICQLATLPPLYAHWRFLGQVRSREAFRAKERGVGP